jgi:hypothetical protein
MNAAIDVVILWKDLVISIFSNYPFAAAIFTLLSVGAFFYLEKKTRPKNPITNALMALLGWAIGVPLVGGFSWFVLEIWGVIKAVAPPIASFLSAFYSIYSKHPILVLALLGGGIPIYAVWTKWRPELLPNKTLRIAALLVGWVLAVFVLGPIAELVTPVETAVARESPPPTPATIPEKTTPLAPTTQPPSTTPEEKPPTPQQGAEAVKQAP